MENDKSLNYQVQQAGVSHELVGDYYMYFGLGHHIKLIDRPAVFKVSPAGLAFGSLLVRLIGQDCCTSKFLDLGTGSGVHALLLRSMGMRSICGTDISKDAISTASDNEYRNFGTRDISFLAGDLFQGVPDLERYDVILFNPPGWRTPSASFLKIIEEATADQGLPFNAMFYGEETLARFFQQLPNYLSDNGKAIIGLNSLIGIRKMIQKFLDLHQSEYEIDCRLLERHSFPLMFYNENWQRIKSVLIDEMMRWVEQGHAYCYRGGNGQIMWSYEIVEFTMRKK